MALTPGAASPAPPLQRQVARAPVGSAVEGWVPHIDLCCLGISCVQCPSELPLLLYSQICDPSHEASDKIWPCGAQKASPFPWKSHGTSSRNEQLHLLLPVCCLVNPGGALEVTSLGLLHVGQQCQEPLASTVSIRHGVWGPGTIEIPSRAEQARSTQGASPPACPALRWGGESWLLPLCLPLLVTALSIAQRFGIQPQL